MQKNEGNADRVVRGLIAVVAAIAAIAVGAGTVWGVVLWIVAAIMAGTAIIGMCPIYRLLRLDSRPQSQRSS
jgi:fatty acid desaturase